MSPAAMYSLALSTIERYCAGEVFEAALPCGGPLSSEGVDLSSARSKASTTAESRSVARESATRADTCGSGRTGATTVIVSCTASNTMITVGRRRIASGMPIGSGLLDGNSSISRTMS
jgi:hypothetical protein